MHDFGFDFEWVLCILVLCVCGGGVFARKKGSLGQIAEALGSLAEGAFCVCCNGSLGQTAEGLGSLAEWNSSNMHPHLATTDFFFCFFF